jgi:hypothetical protein
VPDNGEDKLKKIKKVLYFYLLDKGVKEPADCWVQETFAGVYYWRVGQPKRRRFISWEAYKELQAQ